METQDNKKLEQLGQDFLTHLCYQSDKNAGAFKPASGEGFSLWINGRICFEDPSTSPPNTILYSGDDFSTEELKNCLASGKKVKQVRFRIEKAHNTWVFTISANGLILSGVKVDMPRSTDPDEQFYSRIIAVEVLNKMIDTLFEGFAEEVFGDAWHSTGLKAFQTWLAEKV